jgi:hypothetical protein
MNRKIHISLTPYAALNILSFLREYINDDLVGAEFQTIRENVDEFEREVANKVTSADVEAATHELAIDRLIGKVPDNNR